MPAQQKVMHASAAATSATTLLYPTPQAAERTLDLEEAALGTDGADMADAEHPPPAVLRRAWPDDELVLPHGGLEPFESVPCLFLGFVSSEALQVLSWFTAGPTACLCFLCPYT